MSLLQAIRKLDAPIPAEDGRLAAAAMSGIQGQALVTIMAIEAREASDDMRKRAAL